MRETKDLPCFLIGPNQNGAKLSVFDPVKLQLHLRPHFNLLNYDNNNNK